MVKKTTGDERVSRASGSGKTGDDVAYALPDAKLLELAYADPEILKWAATVPQSPEVDAAAKVIAEESKLAKLDAVKQNTMENLRDLINAARAVGADELVSQLDKALKNLAAAKTPQAITAALAQAQPLIASLSGADKFGDDKVVNINTLNSLHEDLYNKNAMYRFKTDRIDAQAKAQQTELDNKQVAIDTLAREKKIVTSCDEDIKNIEEAIAREKAGENNKSKLRQLEVQRADLLIRQNKERQENAPDKETADKFREHGDFLEIKRKEALKNLEEQMKALEEVILEELKKNGNGVLSEAGARQLEKIKEANQKKLSEFGQQSIAAIDNMAVKTETSATKLRNAMLLEKTEDNPKIVAEDVSVAQALSASPHNTPANAQPTSSPTPFM